MIEIITVLQFDWVKLEVFYALKIQFTLTPACNLPLKAIRGGIKLVLVNLQIDANTDREVDFSEFVAATLHVHQLERYSFAFIFGFAFACDFIAIIFVSWLGMLVRFIFV